MTDLLKKKRKTEKLQFPFQPKRSLQAAAYLLKLAENKELESIHLLKMLYIADREFLLEYGSMITGDRVVAMTRGPVLIHIFNALKGKGEYAQIWNEHFVISDKYNLKLFKDPGIGELNKASMELLENVFQRFGHLKSFEVVQLTHEFPEWQHYYRPHRSKTIPLQAILKAQGKKEKIKFVKKEIQLQNFQAAMRKAIQ